MVVYTLRLDKNLPFIDSFFHMQPIPVITTNTYCGQLPDAQPVASNFIISCAGAPISGKFISLQKIHSQFWGLSEIFILNKPTPIPRSEMERESFSFNLVSFHLEDLKKKDKLRPQRNPTKRVGMGCDTCCFLYDSGNRFRPRLEPLPQHYCLSD